MKNLGAKATRYIAKSWERSLPNEAYSKFLSNHKKLIKVSYISGTNLSKTFLLRISCSTLRTFPHYQWNLTIKDTKCFSFVNVVEAVVQSLLRKRCSENIPQICRRTPMRRYDLTWVFSCEFAAYFQNTFS